MGRCIRSYCKLVSAQSKNESTSIKDQERYDYGSDSRKVTLAGGSETIPKRSCSISTSAGSGTVPGPLNTDLQATNSRWMAVEAACTLRRVLRLQPCFLTSLSPFRFVPTRFPSAPLLASTFIPSRQQDVMFRRWRLSRRLKVRALHAPEI
ncbi:hypothetical protein B296_00048903 [Ensete ventricosum]|uniref:Uncharacterized protein n=1 Tax=Ensete ventricosum TaxID=4639 RepID=A0A426YSW7_ENSVE|nr:hypothetical protein B296_00048903 [Ensete ventricosum]